MGVRDGERGYWTEPAASSPCDRTDLPEYPDMHCPCGYEAGDHPAWRARTDRAREARRVRLG